MFGWWLADADEAEESDDDGVEEEEAGDGEGH